MPMDFDSGALVAAGGISGYVTSERKNIWYSAKCSLKSVQYFEVHHGTKFSTFTYFQNRLEMRLERSPVYTPIPWLQALGHQHRGAGTHSCTYLRAYTGGSSVLTADHAA